MPRLQRLHFPALRTLLPLAFSLAVLLVPQAAGALMVSEGGGDLPASYEKLFRELTKGLTEFSTRLKEIPVSAGQPVSFFATLTTADGRRGRVLLESGGMEDSLVMLDALKDVGVQGIKVAIPYPLVVPGQPLAAEYLDYYVRLAQEVRRRGLALFVHMSPEHRNPAFARQKDEVRFGALDRLGRVARAQAETVLAALKPDILGLVNEPSNAAASADLPDLATAEGLTRFLGAVGKDLSHNGTRIAAGLGSWDKPELAAALVASPQVELFDIHVYAVRGKSVDYLAQADDYAQLARLLGKPVALGEVWLYKASIFELSVRHGDAPATSQDVFRRDIYGFWSPLDTAFLRLMGRLASTRGLEFVCPFWSQYLFSYLAYEPHLESTAYPAVVRYANMASYDAMRRGRLSATGQAFREMIRGGAR
jgi:hypothetical protein